MGSRDNDIVDDRRDDEVLRRLLERYAQPAAVPPPPDLVTRTMRRLPQQPPVAAARAAAIRARRRLAIVVALAGALALIALLGIWGVLGGGPSLALLFGDGVSGLSRALLTIELLSKPLLRTAGSEGGLMIAGLLALAGASWLWWRMLRRTPVVYTEHGV